MKDRRLNLTDSVFITALVMAVGIAVADLALGPSVSFGFLLLLPVMLCAWGCPSWQRLVVCTIAACLWLGLDLFYNEHSAEALVRGRHAVIGLGMLLIASELTARAARQNAALNYEISQRKCVEARLRELNDTLEEKVAQRTTILETRSSELAQSEAALRRQAEVLESVLESMSDGVVVLDDGGQVRLCNPEAGRWLRISVGMTSFREWLQNRDAPLVAGALTPQTAGNEWKQVLQAAQTGQPLRNLQIGSRSTDDVERTALWDVVPLRNAADRPVGAVAVGRDVTELANAQQRLIRSNRDLEETVRARTVTLAERAALLELSFDAIIVRDAQDRITYWNKGAEEMYGWDRKTAHGQTTHSLLQTEFPEPLAEIQRELKQAGRWSGELVHTCRNGRQINVATRWTLQLDDLGHPVAVLESNSDITQHRQMEVALRRTLEQKVAERTATIEKRTAELSASEKALRRQAQVLQSILNSMGDAVIVADVHANVLLCNPEAAQLLRLGAKTGRLMSTAHDHELRETSTDQSRPERPHPLILYLGGKTLDGAEMLLRPDGSNQEIWALVRSRPLIDEGGELEGTVIVLTDVTVRRSLEKQVAEISEREQRRIGRDLHDGVCQQLVSTAYACNMLAETLAEQGVSGANQATEIYRLIHDAIIQIRNLSRALHPADLTGDGLTSALEELAQTVQETTGIRCCCKSANLIMISDQAVGTHLYRIAQEAVNNAVKHSQASEINIELAGSSEQPILRVSDNGIGVQASNGSKKGMGFGTMSYRARMMEASLSIGSGPSGGTLVTCSLDQSNGKGNS